MVAGISIATTPRLASRFWRMGIRLTCVYWTRLDACERTGIRSLYHNLRELQGPWHHVCVDLENFADGNLEPDSGAVPLEEQDDPVGLHRPRSSHAVKQV